MAATPRNWSTSTWAKRCGGWQDARTSAPCWASSRPWATPAGNWNATSIRNWSWKCSYCGWRHDSSGYRLSIAALINGLRMLRIVPVKFHHAGRQYDFNAQGLELQAGSRVVVETERGRALAIVVTAPREIPAEQAPEGLKSVLRTATDDDIAQAAANAARERDAVRYCKERVQSRNLEMKLVRAEYAFDGSKIVFYFTAEGRIDFRDLVKDLAHYFHTRIEMRQIGVRDEAKLVGGLGICGRELCCCSFLTEFYPVSVKMAKEQGLALNPTKISGQCGRLLCCLSYEFATYCDLRKGMPKCGKKVEWDS